VISAIESYGLASFLADPIDLIEWKRRRAEDFLKLLKFEKLECDLMSALIEYRFLPLELFTTILNSEPVPVARALRKLEEHCCVERRGDYYEVSSPIRDAVRRDERFDRPDDWKRKLGEGICASLMDYRDDEHISVALLDSAVMAAVRGVEAPKYITALILPSHLLAIARRYYDNRQPALCIQFCKRAFEMKSRLTADAQIEVLRLWGLSAVRAGEQEQYENVVQLLRQYPSNVARRHALFVEGFYLRRHNKLDEAETKFLECWKLSKDNQSVNRELASLYCKQRQYNDAETHARSAYLTAPTNPFIIDIMAETLLGKAQMRLPVDPAELSRLMGELRHYGDAPGSSFYLVRNAQTLARDKNYPAALDAISRAIDRTDNLLPPYLIRADILLQMNDVAGAERDRNKIDELLQNRGGFSEGDESQLLDLTIRILIEKNQFKAAKEKLDTSNFLPRRVQMRLLRLLARSVAFVPQAATREMLEWARTFNSRQS
jgi:tetratricopeptide (TPR) repeat protein